MIYSLFGYVSIRDYAARSPRIRSPRAILSRARFAPKSRLFTAPAVCLRRANKRSHHLIEAFEQQLGALEIGCVESFGKPIINWSEKIACFSALTLVGPELGKAHCC